MGAVSWRSPSYVSAQGAHAPSSHRGRDESRGLPVVSLLVTYVLLLPLVIFAVHGGFSFEHGSWNSDLAARGGKIAMASTGAEGIRDSLQSWIGLLLCVAAMLPYSRRIAAVCRRMPLMAALPIYAILSALWSQDAALSFRSGVLLLIGTLFAFYLAERFSERQQMELILVAGAVVLASSVALVVLWPQFGVDHQLHEGAWQGLFTQKNVCAESTLFLLTPALALMGTSRQGQVLRAIYLCFCLLVIVMTQSRTGWAMTAAYLAFFASLRILGKLQRRDLLPVVALAFALGAGAAVVAIQYPMLLLSFLSRSDSFSGRAQIWTAVLAAISRHPIGGYGFDAFWSLLYGEASRVFASTGWVVTSAHNGFLNVGLELGLVGLALVGFTFAQAARRAGVAFHSQRSPYVDWCIGLVFLTLIYNLDERTLMATQYLPWVLYIVACTGLERASRESRRVPRSCLNGGVQ